MDFKLLFLLVAFCVVGSAMAGWKRGRPIGGSTGPYNPNPRPHGHGRPVRSVPLEQDEALDEIYEYVEPLVDSLRQKRFSVPIIVLPPPPPPTEDYTV